MDYLLTKYFWCVHLLGLIVIAFFFARGTGMIIAAELQSLAEEHIKPVEKRRAPLRTERKRSLNVQKKDGLPILARNIFDSKTGPIDPQAEDKLRQALEEGLAEKDDDSPLPLVPCAKEPQNDVKLLATVASRKQEAWAFASISRAGKSMLCRVGDDVGSRVVSGITWRYLFLKGEEDECYIDLFSEQNIAYKRHRPKKQTAQNSRRVRNKSKAIEGIRSISETKKVVDRSYLEKTIANPTALMRSVRIRPFKREGEMQGYKLRRFRSNSPLAALGAKKGDIIQAVNGKKLTSIDSALAAYQALRNESNITFSILRRGKPMEIDIAIE